MEDMVVYKKGDFIPANLDVENLNDSADKYNVFLVNSGTSGGSKDWFSYYETDEYIGVKIGNCCGGGIIAAKK